MKIVVKIGGAALEDSALLYRAAQSIKLLADEHQVAVVHGGGAALTRMLAQVGKTTEFVDGLRVTDAETRDLAVMVLAGHMNKKNWWRRWAAWGSPPWDFAAVMAWPSARVRKPPTAMISALSARFHRSIRAGLKRSGSSRACR